MDELAQITALWRYPVKSLQGEAVDTLALRPGGVAGDRALGVVDDETGRVLSAKTVPELLLAAAHTDGDDVVVTLPDGTELGAAEATASAALSSWLDRAVRLARAEEAPAAGYEMTFDPPDDTAERVEIPTPPGSFCDLADLHVLSRTALATLAAAEPDHEWDIRRFRPNVVVAPSEGAREPDDTGYPEHAWIGNELGLGAARVRIDQRTVRCAMPLRAQPGLARDVGLYRALSDRVENHLGLYATVIAPGAVRVGDPVNAG